mmetsp:Transcript_10415/g.20669  ORF Transcript_10415/g.20669 Transcript_10415/m.20669 type:complete len:691 (+) Transcript_10415:3-2075(+)
MASEQKGATLRFQPFSSSVDVSFWHTLSQKKLEEFKLSTKAIPIVGAYSAAPARQKESIQLPARVSLADDAFNTGSNDNNKKAPSADQVAIHGTLLNANTVEEFKAFDKRGLIKAEGDILWKDITSGKCTSDPSLLNRFLLLTFANLKTHRYYYWFAFPALASQNVVITSDPPKPVDQALPPKSVSTIYEQMAKWVRESSSAPSHFVVVQETGATRVVSLSEYASMDPKPSAMFGFTDPSTLNQHPGWPLRNYLVYLRETFKLSKLELLCFRDSLPKSPDSKNSSVFMTVHLSSKPSKDATESTKSKPAPSGSSADSFTTVGWEVNVKGRLGARVVDLRSVFDPKTLARTSADLNLKLMRWRSLPSLDTALLGRTKCLLLGSGTLGCNVARTLLGWGVRHITFVDNGRVSYSNPVRQPLFTYQDSVGGKNPKATTAAAAVKSVCPSAVSEGHVLTIPMPGHTVHPSQVNKVKSEFEKLKALIVSHDVIFLLTDSRESRWLPSVLASAHRKLLVNAALGFDTFVVMRHGVRAADQKSPSLGCYFCNDVVAPTDSLSDRTLDQQCTVTRPGSAPIASALAVELAIALIHHMRHGDQKDSVGKDADGELGSMPHQIRGSLRRFELISVTGNAFAQCTACSETIVKLYHEKGWKFVFDALNSPSYLEDITGLTKMKKEAEAMSADIDWDSSEEL